MLARKAFFSFTGINDPAKHRDYNEWHQLDHRPENLALPGVVWGERWVHSPDCAAVAVLSFTARDASAAPVSVRETALSIFCPTVEPSSVRLQPARASMAALIAHKVRVFIIEVLS